MHGVCGIWGSIAIAPFADSNVLAHGRLVQLGIQLCGSIVCVAWGFGLGKLIFIAVRATCGLRISPEEEVEGAVSIQPDEHEEELDVERLRALMSAGG